LLSLFILVHRAVLSFLIERLCNVFGKSNVLKDNSSEFESLIFEHLVQEVKHLLGLIFALDLINFEICLSTSKDSDTLRDCRFDLLIELVDADVVHELLDGLLVFLAFEYGSHFYFNEDVVVGGAGLNIHLKNYMLLSD
jgi:hypothetical protein